MPIYRVNINQTSINNNCFRRVLFTAPHSQLVVMSLKPGENIGRETHAEVDQFFRVEAGRGKAVVEGDEYALVAGSAVVIPAGTEHDIINTSASEALKFYTIYSPPNHPAGTVHETRDQAMAQEVEHQY
jgi:mannose-6-phosphate isomerase-like protein (cupin superfamily)